MPREIAAGDRQIARLLGAAGKHDRIIFGDELFRIEIDADIDAAVKLHAFRHHLMHAPVDQMLFHLEVGNAIAQQAAGLQILLKDMHLVAGAGELLRAGETRGA